MDRKPNMPPNKYSRRIRTETVDVYDVLRAFNVTCPARQHAIKKLLAAGQRGGKSEIQDIREAIQSAERAIELIEDTASEAMRENRMDPVTAMDIDDN